MRSRRILLAGMTALSVAVGCQNNPEKQSQQDPQHSSDALLAQTPVPQPPPQDPARPVNEPILDEITLLAQKAQAHAQRVEAELQNHPRQQPAADAPLVRSMPSKQPVPVQQIEDPEIPEFALAEWLDPQVLSLSPALPSAPTEPRRQVARTTPSRHATAQPAMQTDRPQADTPPERGSANKPVAITNEEQLTASTKAPVELPAAVQPPAASAAISSESESSLSRALAQRIQDDPNDPLAHLDYQLLRYIEGKPVPDLGTLASLPREDQEIVTAVLDALSNFRNNLRADSNLLLSRKIRPLMDLGDRLRAQADLEIPTLQLCRRVDGFGVYEPIEHRFVAGRDRDVIVYCEVANFMSQLTEQQQWETRLTQEVVLYTDVDGLPILRDKPIAVPDLSRNRRHDFFVVRRLRLPANIPVGRYWLKVTIVDQLASRVAEASIPITFVAN